MLNRRILLALTLGASLLSLAIPAWAQSPIKVVASFSILGDIVHQIGGDHIALTTLVGPDGDAHVYEPTPADARAVGEADLLVVNGLGFESWLPRLLDASDFHGTTTTASQGITPRAFAGEGDEHEANGQDHPHVDDPHAWQDLSNGILYVKTITAALAAADPANAADYQKNGDAYAAELEALNATVKADLAALPEDRRSVVTSHDAFGYFGAAYGIDFIAPEGVSTEAEASAADVAAIIDQIKAEDITAVFVENITNPRLIEQISSETGVKVGGELFSDALSPADGPAPTYVRMFRNNVAQLVANLKAD